MAKKYKSRAQKLLEMVKARDAKAGVEAIYLKAGEKLKKKKQ